MGGTLTHPSLVRREDLLRTTNALRAWCPIVWLGVPVSFGLPFLCTLSAVLVICWMCGWGPWWGLWQASYASKQLLCKQRRLPSGDHCRGGQA
eukprot:1147355-Pelagomonas_calceolata.AAC.5